MDFKKVIVASLLNNNEELKKNAMEFYEKLNDESGGKGPDGIKKLGQDKILDIINSDKSYGDLFNTILGKTLDSKLNVESHKLNISQSNDIQQRILPVLLVIAIVAIAQAIVEWAYGLAQTIMPFSSSSNESNLPSPAKSFVDKLSNNRSNPERNIR